MSVALIHQMMHGLEKHFDGVERADVSTLTYTKYYCHGKQPGSRSMHMTNNKIGRKACTSARKADKPGGCQGANIFDSSSAKMPRLNLLSTLSAETFNERSSHKARSSMQLSQDDRTLSKNRE